ARNHYWVSYGDRSASDGRGVQAFPNTGFSTGDRSNGPRLDYEVTFETPGTYYVWAQMYGPSGADNSIHVGLDGEPATYGHEGMSASNRWGWVNEVEKRRGRKDVTVYVPRAGTYTLNLWMREDGVRVDKLVLARDHRYKPQGQGPAPTEQK